MKAKILILLTLAAIITIGAVALITNNGGDSPADVRYNYDLEVVDSYTDSYGDLVEANAGTTFVIATVTVANDHYEDGIKTNWITLNWTIKTSSGIDYDSCADTIFHPDYQDVTINAGSVLTYAVVFEVPDSNLESDILELVPDYLTLEDMPTFELDSTLLVS